MLYPKVTHTDMIQPSLVLSSFLLATNTSAAAGRLSFPAFFTPLVELFLPEL